MLVYEKLTTGDIIYRVFWPSDLLTPKLAHYMHEVSIAAEKIFEFAGYTVTNSVLMTVIISLLLIIAALTYRAKMRFIPSKLQSLFEMPIEGMYNLSKQVSPEHGHEFFPLVTTIFLFVLISNWVALLPGITGFGVKHVSDTSHTEEIDAHAQEQVVEDESHEEETNESITPLLRATTADLNTTIALAIIAVVASHYYGFKHLGAKLHIKKYINFDNPINTFVGILELIGEFAKVISFAFRLFGNIFAGEVLLIVMGLVIPTVFPRIFPGIEIIASVIQFPFLGLEVFVGFIQALVFAMLTLVFCSIATQHH